MMEARTAMITSYPVSVQRADTNHLGQPGPVGIQKTSMNQQYKIPRRIHQIWNSYYILGR